MWIWFVCESILGDKGGKKDLGVKKVKIMVK